MCTVYFVDEATKQKIAAYNARFREVSASPFGADDQIGMLNLIDANRAPRSSARRRRQGVRPRSRPLRRHAGWLAANDPSFQIWMTHTRAARRSPTDGGRARRQPARVLLGGCGLDVHPHRDPRRFPQSLRLPRPDLQQLLRPGSSWQPALAGGGRRQAPAGDRPRAAARRRGAAWRGDAAAEPRHRAKRPRGLPPAPGQRAAPRRRGDDQDRAHARRPIPAPT